MDLNEEGTVLREENAVREGDTKATSVHTPQTIETGEAESAPDAGEQAITREERFRALVEGEYKDLFTALFQETFNRRFKEHRNIEAELERQRAVIAAVEERFGTTDREALLAAIRAEGMEKNALTERGEPPASSVSAEEIERIAAEARQALLAQIRARGTRPAECAIGTSPCTYHGGGRMSREERAELARRAARGEHIVF